MAAYAALVSLLNNIHTIMKHPRFSTSLDNENIQPLLQKTNFLLEFMEGNYYGAGSKEAQDLERKITSAAHAAEDLIEFSIVDQIQPAEDQSHGGEGEASHAWPYLLTFLLKCVGCHVSDGSQKLVDLQWINRDMDAIMKEANKFKEKHMQKEEQQPTHLARPLMQSGKTTMVGLDAELNQLLDELTGYQSSRRIISIVGMGGTGKTTLARNVYEHLLIKGQFQFRAWATISQQNNAKEVLLELLSDVGEFSSEEVDDLGLRLHKTLMGRRYLIVLDDIWSVKAWDEVKRFFPDNKNASRILLTTRLSNVAKDCGSSLLRMNLLDEENSWKLFCEKTFQNRDCPPELREIGDEIVKLCQGLALSIVVIGGLLLKSPRTVGYWKGVAEDLKSIPNSEEKQESLDVLSLSYNHLPHHLKPCFLYMGVFREDSWIRATKIIQLWVAEGFIKPNGSRLLEDIAEGYVNDLIDRNLILVGMRRKNGKVRSCGIHDLLRDLCIKLAEQQEFYNVNLIGLQGIERRLVYSWYTRWSGMRLSVTRSVIARGTFKQLIGYRLLRVLDETSMSLHLDYYENVNLRYLAYIPGSGSLFELPTSISHIWNLQTLIIKRHYDLLLVVPAEFWTMHQLRHVECNNIYILDPHLSNRQDQLLMFENLHTLKTILNLRLCEELCKIIPNIKTFHLLYDIRLQGYDDNLVDFLCNLDRLHKLESLSLSIDTILPESIFPNTKRIKKLVTSFPRSLKKLIFKMYQLHWEDLSIIGSLPLLEVLKLEHIFVWGEEQWSPVDGQFHLLKFLKIKHCRLACWDAENSHFPALEKLHFEGLDSLEEIPLAIGDIPTLELIRVDFCSNSAALSAVRIKEDQLENDTPLQVQVRMREKHLENFNQMLETEGLTIDNIQLEVSRGYK